MIYLQSDKGEKVVKIPRNYAKSEGIMTLILKSTIDLTEHRFIVEDIGRDKRWITIELPEEMNLQYGEYTYILKDESGILSQGLCIQLDNIEEYEQYEQETTYEQYESDKY